MNDLQKSCVCKRSSYSFLPMKTLKMLLVHRNPIKDPLINLKKITQKMYFQQETLKWLSVIKSPWKGLLPFEEVNCPSDVYRSSAYRNPYAHICPYRPKSPLSEKSFIQIRHSTSLEVTFTTV